jgi:transcriptional regulator with XRE-family HTH domain
MIMLIDKQFIAQMNILFQDGLYSRLMAGRPSSKKPTDNGARLAALRKTAGLSQMQLANAIGIPQRTLSFYERDAESVPSDLLPRLAQALGVTVEALLGLEKEAKSKRGPKSKLERQFEAVSKLPPSKQQFVSKLLDQLLVSKAA